MSVFGPEHDVPCHPGKVGSAEPDIANTYRNDLTSRFTDAMSIFFR
jgi:hypothetical protein